MIDDELTLECLRIPHFYRAFYVYKYATGLSAAIALAERVASGGKQELNDYLAFLKGGCSKYPLDLLAGRRRRHDEPRPGRNGAHAVRAAGGRTGRLALIFPCVLPLCVLRNWSLQRCEVAKTQRRYFVIQ